MGRKKYSKELKARIALDEIKGQKTIAELASEYGVHANQISIWKKQLLDTAPAAFSSGKDKDAEKKEVERDHLYQKVGQLQIEVDWLKKRPAIRGCYFKPVKNTCFGSIKQCLSETTHGTVKRHEERGAAQYLLETRLH